MDEKLDIDEMRAEVVEHGVLDYDQAQELLSRLERAEARVKLLESGIVSELVVTSVHSASAIGTTVSGISEELLKLGYDGLTERLEQAEKNADTYQTLYEQRAESLEQAEQTVQRVREVHPITFYDKWGRNSPVPLGRGGWCPTCGRFDGDACRTIRALDGEQS